MSCPKSKKNVKKFSGICMPSEGGKGAYVPNESNKGEGQNKSLL